MSTRETIVAAALDVLEREGTAQFSTRAVCSLANVTAPTLYHHFGSADGLLSAALAEAFRQFLARKQAAAMSPDPAVALREGWDDYVRFAAEHPRLYAAMLGRLLSDADIPAAREAFALLEQRIADLAAAGRLAVTSADAAQLAWASANAAAMLHVPVAWSGEIQAPGAEIIANLRDQALRTICGNQTRGEEA